jgi:hypothetical protein
MSTALRVGDEENNSESAVGEDVGVKVTPSAAMAPWVEVEHGRNSGRHNGV